MRSPITFSAYNSDWPRLFSEEAAQLKKLLGENCVAIHHIGSTAIPGLKAKPIIDMLPVVKDISAVDATLLIDQGYKFSGELGMPFRRYFSKRIVPKSFHVHIWEEGHPEIEKHLLFCDYLRAHPDETKRYETLKGTLAHKHADNKEDYTRGKDTLIQELVRKSGFKGLLISEPFHEREKSFYNSLFGGASENHAFVFYKGADLIGGTSVDEAGVISLQFISAQHESHKPYFEEQLARWFKMRLKP